MTTFVSVGNATQPFNRLIESVIENYAELPQPVVIQHGNTPLANIEKCVAKPFLGMNEFSSQLKQAELLILHGGAGSVIHAIKAGKIPVIMPRRAQYGEHVDDHQLEFSRALAEAGKVVLAEEPEDLMRSVEKSLEMQATNTSIDSEPPLVGLISEVLRRYAEGL